SRNVVTGVFLAAILFSLVGLYLPRTILAAVSVSQWSLLELPFTSQTSYSNAYSGGIDLSATFTNPAGVQKTVQGFWDGGNQFKVRFAPSTQGNWTYKTYSSRDASLSNRTGSFSVTAPLAG